MKYKMNKKRCRSSREHYRPNLYGRQKLNILFKNRLNQGIDQNDKNVYGHMVTYPFRTVDNSLHWSCEGLAEFNHHSGTDGLNDAVYGRNNIAFLIIIDEESVSSVTPGHDMDDDMMNFCLSW